MTREGQGRKGRAAPLRVALAFVLLCSVARADSPVAFEAWPRIESVEWKFSVRFPAIHERSESVRSTWVGKVNEMKLDADFPSWGVAVQARELPPGTSWLVTDNYLFSQVKDGILKGGERREISESKVSRDGHPGRRIRYEDPAQPGWVEEALVLLVESRLYMLFASHDKGREASLPIDDFFASFEIR